MKPSLAGSCKLQQMAYSPPPFNPGMAQKKKSPVGMILMIVALVFLLVCGLGGFALFQFGKGATQMVSSVIQCTLTFDLTQKAALAYAKENKGVLPTADKWQEQISPYYIRLKTKVLGQMTEMKEVPFFNFEPSDISEPLSCSFGEPTTGITFNKALSGKKLADIKDPLTTPLFFESETIAVNSSAEYKERAKDSGPKMMGSGRDWITWNVQQDENPFASKSGNMDFNVSIEDALGAKEEKPSGAPTAPAAP